MAKPLLSGFALGVVATVLIAVAVWLTVAYTGAYNVAASDQHADAVRWTLDTTMHRSVEGRSGDVELPETFSDDIVAEGAERCSEGCVYCHDAPGQDATDWSPPHLMKAAEEWSAEEIYWIVENEIKMSGMTAFGAHHGRGGARGADRLVSQLPGLSPEDYRALTGGGAAGNVGGAPAAAAIMMGATMAVIMLAYMLGMYANKTLNIAIFAGAHELILAQRREIAEMRYLIAEVSEGNIVESIYRDPVPEVGTVDDAVGRALISTLDPSPMPEAEAEQILEPGSRCAFNRSPETDPMLWAAEEGGQAAMKLNGVLVPLEAGDETDGGLAFTAPGVTMTVRPLGDEADWRSDAELVFALEQGLTVGYRGFWACEA